MTTQLCQYGVLQKSERSSFLCSRFFAPCHSLPPPSVPSLLVIRNRCAGKWVACQDQVCFCPFKAKKPGGTFLKEREGWRKAEKREGPL